MTHRIQGKFYALTSEVCQKLRKGKLTGAEWRIWSYLVEKDPYGDRYMDERQVYLWDLRTRSPMAYDLDNRTLKSISDRQYKNIYLRPHSEPTIGFRVSYQDGARRLVIGRKVGETWEDEVIPVEAETLFKKKSEVPVVK